VCYDQCDGCNFLAHVTSSIANTIAMTNERGKTTLVMVGRDLRGSNFGGNDIHNDQIFNFVP